MPTRAHPVVRGIDLLESRTEDDVIKRPAKVSADILRNDAFSMFAALRVPAQRLRLMPDAGPGQSWLLARDGSWAYQAISDDESVVVQGGPARLWDMLEDAYADWEALGRPPRQVFGLTVAPAGRHLIWHGTPAGPTWPL